jgi:hypothetical protein
MVRVFHPEKSVRGSSTLFHCAELISRARWRRGRRPCFLALTATKWTTSRGTPLTQSCSAPPAKRTDGSCSGTHGVCDLSPASLSGVSLFSRSESRHLQQCTLKVSPVQINYAPDGKSLLYVSSGNQLFFMSYGKDSEDSTAPAQWSSMDRSAVHFHFSFSFPPAPNPAMDS